MKIAMPGFDLATATDNQLLFNSSFPILQIKVFASLGYITSSPSGNGTEAEMNTCNFGGEYLGVIDGLMTWRWHHGLGYPPFYIPIGANGVTFGSPFSVDENYIYYRSNVYAPVIGWNGVYQGAVDKCLVCPINISKDIEYPYTASPLDFNYGSIGDYGFKSVELGDITQKNFDNLGIDPRLQSQMILAVKTMDTMVPGSNVIEYQLPTGMTTDDVVVYGFMKSATKWSHLYTYSQNPPSIFVYPDTNIVKIVLLGTETNVSMVLTRMPIVSPYFTETII